MKSKRLITFAGVVGSSKTPIAYYLSWNLGLPILNNDAMRTEVIEDIGKMDQDEYLKRRDDRLKKVFESGKSFIYDASVDRAWSELAEHMQKANYKTFVISLDLSKRLLLKLYKRKNYTDVTPKGLEKLIREHDGFLEKYSDVVDLRITDKEFPKRLQVSQKAVQKWL